jgi:chlorobactene glucosyltransferase
VEVVWALLVLGTLLSLYNLAFAPRLEGRALALDPFLSVSLLIPVRNEAHQLAELIQHLEQIRYPELEIIILDDQSTDSSASLIQAAAARGVCKSIRGAPLPSGWVGKNWACHQLAEQALGDWLLFADADVRMSPESVSQTVASANYWRADAITALPYQQMVGASARAVVPLIMHQPVAALLPLRFLARRPSPRAFVCNGQWLAIKRSAYIRSGGHRAVKHSLLEDMALGKRLLEHGQRLVPLIATHSLRVQMYRNWGEMKEGFTKNVYLLLGGNIGYFAFWLFVFGLINVAPFFSWPTLGLLILHRLCIARLFRESWRSVGWHPLGVVLLYLLALRSFFHTRAKRVVWKHRLISHSG